MTKTQGEIKKQLNLKIQMLEILIHENDTDRVCTIGQFMAQTGGSKKDVKCILDELKKGGTIEVVFAVDDDGFMAGRGYVLTYESTRWSVREWLEQLKKIRQDY